MKMLKNILSKLIVLGFIVGIVPDASAQKTDTLVFYLDEDSRYLTGKEGAEYLRMVIRPAKPETLYTVYDFYMNGSKRLATTSNKDDGSIFQGPCIYYFKTGKRAAVVEYKNGWDVGEFVFYYPNGKLNYIGKMDKKDGKRRVLEYRDSLGNITAQDGNGAGIEYAQTPLSFIDRGPIVNGLKDGEWLRFSGDTLKCKLFYSENLLTSGVGFDSLGNQYMFRSIKEGVRFKQTGPTSLFDLVKNKLVLSKEAKKDKVRGYVMVNFIVETDGSIADPVVTQGLGYGLDEQALNIVKQTNLQWIPAKLYGIPYRDIHQISVPVGIY